VCEVTQPELAGAFRGPYGSPMSEPESKHHVFSLGAVRVLTKSQVCSYAVAVPGLKTLDLACLEGMSTPLFMRARLALHSPLSCRLARQSVGWGLSIQYLRLGHNQAASSAVTHG
jgi:hypothetical protein